MLSKPYKLVFIDGPYDRKERFYSSYYSARRAACRYVSKLIPGRFIFTRPYCELFLISDGREIFLQLFD